MGLKWGSDTRIGVAMTVHVRVSAAIDATCQGCGCVTDRTALCGVLDRRPGQPSNSLSGVRYTSGQLACRDCGGVVADVVMTVTLAPSRTSNPELPEASVEVLKRPL